MSAPELTVGKALDEWSRAIDELDHGDLSADLSPEERKALLVRSEKARADYNDAKQRSLHRQSG